MKRIYRKRIILILGSALLLFFILLPMILVPLHYGMYISEMDNDIVDQRYNGWKDVSLDEKLSIKLPDEWNIFNDPDGNPSIVDADGSLIAAGIKKLYYDPPTVIERNIEQLAGKKILSREVISRDYIRWNTSGFNCIWKIELDNSSFIETAIVRISYHFEYEYIFCFPLGSVNEDCNPPYVAEPEAIAWSAILTDQKISWFTRRALHLM